MPPRCANQPHRNLMRTCVRSDTGCPTVLVPADLASVQIRARLRSCRDPYVHVMELLMQLGMTIAYAIAIGIVLVLAAFFAWMPSGADREGARLERDADDTPTGGAAQRPAESSLPSAA